jgi:hypothetical protein
MSLIEITFSLNRGRYVFRSADGKIWLTDSDRDKAAARFLLLQHGLMGKGLACRIKAYAPLGPWLRRLRDAGAVCRVGLRGQPAPNRVPWQMPGMPVPEPPPPVFASWTDYLARTSYGDRMKRCYAAAKKANRKRLLSADPNVRLGGRHVWEVIERAKGRCAHCGSLAVENRPSSPINGAPIPWAQVGRRIGSLEHIRSRFGGGGNDLSNLAWACLWCNTWEIERRPLAKDHGGHYPKDW